MANLHEGDWPRMQQKRGKNHLLASISPGWTKPAFKDRNPPAYGPRGSFNIKGTLDNTYITRELQFTNINTLYQSVLLRRGNRNSIFDKDEFAELKTRISFAGTYRSARHHRGVQYWLEGSPSSIRTLPWPVFNSGHGNVLRTSGQTERIRRTRLTQNYTGARCS